MSTADNKGPVYNVELIDRLRLGDRQMWQAMPSREDLEQVREVNERVAAGYEVLLFHYRDTLNKLHRSLRKVEHGCTDAFCEECDSC